VIGCREENAAACEIMIVKRVSWKITIDVRVNLYRRPLEAADGWTAMVMAQKKINPRKKTWINRFMKMARVDRKDTCR
jgi:hypothetical protein